MPPPRGLLLAAVVLVAAVAAYMLLARPAAPPPAVTVTLDGAALRWTAPDRTRVSLTLTNDGELRLVHNATLAWSSASGLRALLLDSNAKVTSELTALRGAPYAAAAVSVDGLGLWVRGRWFFVGDYPWIVHAWSPLCGPQPHDAAAGLTSTRAPAAAAPSRCCPRTTADFCCASPPTVTCRWCPLRAARPRGRPPRRRRRGAVPHRDVN
jgi:hypothetical protein